MDADVKAEWVAALRSGEYTQTRGKLCRADGRMCCLGVLIDITQDGEWELEPKEQFYAFENASSMPSALMLHKLGIDWRPIAELAAKNDAGMPFSRIADFIEANL